MEGRPPSGDRPPEYELLPPDDPSKAPARRPIPVAPPSVSTTVVRPRFEHRFGNLGAYFMGRLLAALIDTGAIAFVFATFAFSLVFHSGTAMLFIPGLGGSAVRTASEVGFVFLASASLATAVVFAYLCEAIFSSTLGKLLFGLAVRRTNDGWIGFGRALVRNLLRPIDLVAIGPILALITPKHQRLGDLLAGTVVSRARSGPFAPLVALIAFAVIGYLQITFGGGLTSVLGVSALATQFGPDVVQRVTGLFGGTPVPVATPSAEPLPASSPATAAGSAPPTAQPSATTVIFETPRPGQTASPAETPPGNASPVGR